MLISNKISLQEFAINQLIQIKDFYSKSPSLMFEHYEHEKTTTIEYEGRELLELIQNADDAAHNSKEPKALIYLSNNRLIIANTGQTFSEGGLDSIFHSNLSPKFDKQNQIGNKGLGFRSTLSWADKVSIISGDLKISFSKLNSKGVLDYLMNLNNAIGKKIIDRYGKMEDAIAIFRCPDIIENITIPEVCKDFDTLIILDLKAQILVDGIFKNAVEVVEEQINKSVDAEMLLFLNNLDSIIIQTPNIAQTLKRKILIEKSLSDWAVLKRIKLSKFETEDIDKEWNIYCHSGTNKLNLTTNQRAMNFELAVAWQDELTESKNVLHSFFRTDVSFKFPGILHGTFELSSNRNELIKGQGHNRFLFDEVAKLLAEAAQIIATSETENVNYNSMHLTMVDFGSLSNLIKESGFETKLKEEVKKRKIFPTIGNQYISWADKPAYYEEPEFAELLNAEDFPNLLLCCDNETEENFLTALDCFDYEINDIIDSVAEKRKILSTTNYALLIKVIHNRINKKEVCELNHLFYDIDFKLLNFCSPIFLPNKDLKNLGAAEIGLQILNPSLASSLMEAFDVEDYKSLSVQLSNFKIKEFNFNEAVEILITHYNSEYSTIKDIVELNKHLFNIYSGEGNPESKWVGTAVPLLDKTGKKSSAHKLYFGKEYGNLLAEEIYHFDKGKILATPKRFKVEELNEAPWKKYLEWLGVTYLPRKIYIGNISADYITYCLQNYNYKNRLDDYSFNNYSELKKSYLQFGESKVQSIDSLEKILNSNSFELIIRWLEADNELLSKLIEDRESKDCRIGIKFNADHNFRHLQGANIKSYIKWHFQNIPWIETEGRFKQAPNLCTTASNVNADFSPHIEKPLINYERFLRLGINRDKLEHFLAIVGVHKSMTTFSTKTLYSILLKLPGMDEGKKKGKTIYNQLATNFDNKLLDKIDKTDPSYLEFHTKGQVFCKNGELVPIKEVYYVNDKRYGEAVIKYFNIIEIDRRRGKEIIKKLFGVEPLDKMDLNLDRLPTFHPDNSDFENEIKSFKPYVYILRKDADGGSEKNTIKNTTFKLVTDIRLILLKDDKPQIIELNDYECFYLKKRGIVYIKAPENLKIEELNKDMDFCSAIAEAFSAILDVDSQRQLLIHLFSIKESARDSLLRNELDGNYSQKISESRQILGFINNPKLEFWKAFAKCSKGKKINITSKLDIELLIELKNKYPKHAELISSVFNQINYLEINEELSLELIVNLFQNTGITLNQFNQFHYPAINIKELYEINFKRTIDRTQNVFKSLYYEKCLGNNELKQGFCDVLKGYSYIKPNVINEVNFDVEKDVIDQIKHEYNIDISNEVLQLNIDEIYQKNLEQLWQYYEQTNNERKLFDQFINEKTSTRSLIYFEDQINNIKDQFIIWVGQTPIDNNKTNSITKNKRIAFGNHTILYDDLADLKNQIDSFLKIEGLTKITSTIIKTTPTDAKSENNEDDKAKGGNKGRTPPKIPKEEVGFIGEYMVYRFLLDTIDDFKSVKWVSAYARDCGINLDGKDGLGYDLEYIPNGGKNSRYVEVKVVGWEDAFHISSNEVEYGEKYKKNYEIFLVRNLDSPTNAKIERIQGLFDYKGKSFTNNDLFSVINDNFIIKFKKVK